MAYEILCHYYKYIYFRVEENPYETLHLENMSFQRLMNKDILADIEEVLNSKNPETRMSVIQSINDNLSEYLDNINAILQNTGENFRFTYKRNQPNKITARHLREIVISRFLSVRTLKSESKDLQDLSSGEQRQALIKVASTFIKDTKDNLTGELILAIDEPENSLHIKNLYHQFNSLISLHQYCQVIMTTHWYGILPILNQESLHIVQKRQSREKSNTIEISSYLAEHFFGNKMNYRVEDAANILVKSYFDLTNSIVMMARLGTNFIICEGLTDKRYLEYYLDLQNRHTDNLHIIALGGIANVVKLYKYLYLALSDITSLKKESDADFGKILCITDLDDYQPDLDVPSCLKDKGESILSIRKIVYDSKEKKSSLLEYSASGNYERIEIEDSLHPEHLFKVLKDILQEEEKTSSLAKKLRFNTKRIHAHSKVDDELDSIFNKENLSRDEIQIVNSLFKKKHLFPKSRNNVRSFISKANHLMKGSLISLSMLLKFLILKLNRKQSCYHSLWTMI